MFTAIVVASFVAASRLSIIVSVVGNEGTRSPEGVGLGIPRGSRDKLTLLKSSLFLSFRPIPLAYARILSTSPLKVRT